MVMIVDENLFNSPTLVECQSRDACLGSERRMSLLPERVRRKIFFILTVIILPQVLSDMPYTDRWTSCPSSYDRLMWLVQRNPRVGVIVSNFIIWLAP